MSGVLITAILVVLALASSVLLWEGLATGLHPGSTLARRDLWRVRFRFTAGALVFAVVLWIALGLLTHAH